MKILSLLALLPLAAAAEVVDFEGMPIGSPPIDWTIAQTGRGAAPPGAYNFAYTSVSKCANHCGSPAPTIDCSNAAAGMPWYCTGRSSTALICAAASA